MKYKCQIFDLYKKNIALFTKYVMFYRFKQVYWMEEKSDSFVKEKNPLK